MRPHVIYNSINMSNLVAKLTNFYVVELRQHKTFIATYYAVKFLLVGIGAWVIHGNRGFVPMAIVCIAICAVTSTTCFPRRRLIREHWHTSAQSVVQHHRNRRSCRAIRVVQSRDNRDRLGRIRLWRGRAVNCGRY